MSESKLKPCPFCGAKTMTEAIPEDSGRFHVACFAMKCLSRGPYRLTRTGAIAAWNRRIE